MPNPLVYAVYGTLALWFFIRFRRASRQTAYMTLLLSLGCFAFSVGADFLPDVPGQTIAEDGA